ncbi:MAG: PASTA domain-containing protein [Cryomorphaceae bacterium]|nr:MAG: PASTA domain-containing protein [Cryomorphaceae bacterium]
MKNLFFFLFSRALWINVLIAAFVIGGIVLGTMHYLKSYTRHGAHIEVPDFTHVSLDSLDYLFEKHKLRYVIIDSLYSDAHAPGSVVNQNPLPRSSVKENRKVFLTVNATQPPVVTVRDMEGLSKRQALAIMEAMGLGTDSLIYRPDICLDCVLEQRYKGRKLKPGTKLTKGEKITLVLGGGKEGRVLLPDLRGMAFSEARDLMFANTLLLGGVLDCIDCTTGEDTLQALVYRQSPAFSKKTKRVVPMGSTVDLYLTLDTAAVHLMQPDTLFSIMDTTLIEE